MLKYPLEHIVKQALHQGVLQLTIVLWTHEKTGIGVSSIGTPTSGSQEAEYLALTEESTGYSAGVHLAITKQDC